MESYTLIGWHIQDTYVYFSLTLFGSIVMYIFSLFKGFQGAVAFLNKVLPGHSKVFYDRLDFLIVVMTGAIVGTIFFSPSNNLQALAAGFGWVGAINILLNQKEGG
ncbi:MAG: hypothetical protein HYR76_05570 [Ignavibacteria bacterium]|nr:hypothetical protein [Ignavibacteria bacterium]